MSSPRSVALILAVALPACQPDKSEPEESGLPEVLDTSAEEVGTPWFPDLDGDGYGDANADPESSVEAPAGWVADASDCADDNPDIHPGAVELCNRKDDDCDGEIDEDPEVAGSFYPDEDGDGHGDQDAEVTRACSAPDGYTTSHDDCDDAEITVNPDVLEDCTNGRDDDCDGDTDEDESGALAWPDADDDGWGADEGAIGACSAPEEGYSLATGDCDDADPLAFPGADEICDGVDNDCDGEIDVDGTSHWYLDEDGDGYGRGSFSVDGCDAPSDGVSRFGDCDDDDPLISPGATEICENGVDEDCDTVDSSCGDWGAHGLGEADVAIRSGDEDAQTAWAVASAGDNDGDGDTDLWVSSRASGADREGVVYLVPSPVTASGTLPELASAWIEGRVSRAYAGQSLAGDVDVDGDGYPDVWIGSRYDINETGLRAGSAALVYGPFDGGSSLLLADARWMGEVEGDLAGGSVASGADLDLDGVMDLVVGAFYRSSAFSAAGSAYIALGAPPDGDLSLSSADIELTGVTDYGGLGYSVAMVGDTNADGLQDIALQDSFYAASGTITGALFVLTELPDVGVTRVTDAAQTIPGDLRYMCLAEVTATGDVNGDGYDDLAVGSKSDSEGGTEAGATLIVEGPTDDMGTLADATAKWIGTVDYENAEKSAGGQDIDGDGTLDLAVGGWYGAEYFTGAAYLLRGPFEEGTHSLIDADARFMGELVNDEAGRSLAMLRDTNGDGYADLLIGAPGVDDGTGAAYLVLGSPF